VLDYAGIAGSLARRYGIRNGVCLDESDLKLSKESDRDEKTGDDSHGDGRGPLD